MGMSTHIKGIKPPDEKWRKMKTVYDSCVAADVQIPDEVNEFFSWDVPDDKGVVIDLKATASVSEYKGEFEQGFEIDLGLVPSDVKIIRFYQSC